MTYLQPLCFDSFEHLTSQSAVLKWQAICEFQLFSKLQPLLMVFELFWQFLNVSRHILNSERLNVFRWQAICEFQHFFFVFFWCPFFWQFWNLRLGGGRLGDEHFVEGEDLPWRGDGALRWPGHGAPEQRQGRRYVSGKRQRKRSGMIHKCGLEHEWDRWTTTKCQIYN